MVKSEEDGWFQHRQAKPSRKGEIVISEVIEGGPADIGGLKKMM